MTSADNQGDAAEPQPKQSKKKPSTARKTGADKDAPASPPRSTRTPRKPKATSAETETSTPKPASTRRKKPEASESTSSTSEKLPYEVERDTTVDRRAAARRRHSQAPIRTPALQRTTEVEEVETEAIASEITIEPEEVQQEPPQPARPKTLEETVIEILGTPEQPQAIAVDIEVSNSPDISDRQARHLIIWAGILIGITVLLIAGLAIGSNLASDGGGATPPPPTTGTTPHPSTSNSSDTNTTDTTGTTASTAPGQQTSLPAPGTTVAIQLTGDGPRQSALFHLPSGNVRVVYATAGSSLNVHLLREASTGAGEAFTCSEACDRVAIVTENAGSYYLDVESKGGEWNVRIEY